MTTVNYLDQDFAIAVVNLLGNRLDQMVIIINNEITKCFLFSLELKNVFSFLTSCLQRVNMDVNPPTNNSKILECGAPNMSSC